MEHTSEIIVIREPKIREGWMSCQSSLPVKKQGAPPGHSTADLMFYSHLYRDERNEIFEIKNG
jgi:hypothetical protein